jgi:hypothetical protein
MPRISKLKKSGSRGTKEKYPSIKYAKAAKIKMKINFRVMFPVLGPE